VCSLVTARRLVRIDSSATNRLITGQDHSSVQINIGRVNEDGVLTGEYDTIALCGFVRRKGLGDDAFYRLSKKKGYFTPSGKTPATE
jgi:small subunit ribosomal protein S21e